jgi:ADP-ribose pyrophosphatase YjhB (NUDIX family)
MTADIVLLPPFACCFCPQGGWEDDESLEAAARRETVEEAGVRGSIEVSTTRTHISI